MKSSGGTDWVVGWCSHHWGLDHGLGLGLVVGVRHVFPDPKGSGVEWAEIVTDDKLLAEFIVSIDSVFVGFGESPVESCLVNVTASVANFIGFMEIGFLASFMDSKMLPSAVVSGDIKPAVDEKTAHDTVSKTMIGFIAR